MVLMEQGNKNYLPVPLNELSAAQISKLDPFRDDPVIEISDVEENTYMEAEMDEGNDANN